MMKKDNKKAFSRIFWLLVVLLNIFSLRACSLLTIVHLSDIESKANASEVVEYENK